MKKALFLLLISIISHTQLSAQWGVKVGVGTSDIVNQKYSSPIFSWDITGTYDVPLSSKWILQPGLGISSFGFKFDDDKDYLRGGHIKMVGLYAPINFSFRPSIGDKMKMLLDMGWFFRYAFTGNKTYRYYHEPTIDKSPFDAYRRFDTGITLGIGVAYQQLYTTVSYQQSFVYTDKANSYLGQRIMLNLGYNF